MSKTGKSSQAIESTLAQLNELRKNSSSPESIEQLSKALDNASNLVAAKAATIVGEAKLTALSERVASMFHRFVRDAAKTDKGCAAKKAAANTLYEFGASEGALFLTGARHVQKEASWGAPVDTAAELRGICALALVRIGHPRQLDVLAEHLMDPESQVRHVAARACGYSGLDTAALLLRMKICAGDVEDDVIAECFAQLAKIQPSQSIAFIERFVESPSSAMRQAACFALGASRDPAALKILTDRWGSTFDADERAMLVPAIAAHRSKEAIEFLLERLDSVGLELACTIVQGMAAFRHDATIAARVRAIVDERDDGALHKTFKNYFAD